MNAEAPLATALGMQLRVGPPSLTDLISLLENSEGLLAFVRACREFLPDRADEILAVNDERRIARFCRYFADRYFPLHDAASFMWGDGYEYENMMHAIPIEPMGYSWDDFHDLDAYGPGHRLMMCLLADQWWDDGGIKVALMESCAPLVGGELMEHIPPEGYDPKALHERLDGTNYEGLALFADWIWRETDTVFLDVDYEMDNDLQWDRETVEWLAEKWPRVVAIQDQVFKVAAWLEEEPKANFGKLLQILAKVPIHVPVSQLPLVEVFERIRV